MPPFVLNAGGGCGEGWGRGGGEWEPPRRQTALCFAAEPGSRLNRVIIYYSNILKTIIHNSRRIYLRRCADGLSRDRPSLWVGVNDEKMENKN